MINVRKIFIAQCITFVLCLLAGATLILLFAWWTTSWGIRYSDGSNYTYILGAVISFISLFILTWSVSSEQFEQALTSSEVLQAGRFYSLNIIKFAIIPTALLSLMQLLLGSFIGFVIEVVGTVALIFLLGTMIGYIQSVSLNVRQFDPQVHLEMLSKAGDVEALKNNKLPYRQQIYLMNQIAIFFTVGSLFSLGVVVAWIEAQMPGTLFVGIGFIFVVLTKLFDHYLTLVNPKIQSVTGQITKSFKDQRAPKVGRIRTYYLTCSEVEYKTEYTVWENVKEKKVYTLWFTKGLEKLVIAAEKQ